MEVGSAFVLSPGPSETRSSHVDQVCDIEGEHANGAVSRIVRKATSVGTERELPPHP
jgi:hypothetical protein